MGSCFHGSLLCQGYFEQQQQKKLEQQQRIEKELLEKERLEQIKNKKKTEESELSPLAECKHCTAHRCDISR